MVVNIADALSAYKQQTGNNARGKEGLTATGDGGSFSDMLKGFAEDTVKGLKDAEQATAAGTVGKANLQDVILAVNNAEIMMQTFTAIRDKVVGAYQDIMRMPI